ncbi:hypothetical protein ACXR2U_05985 [Jatrophihabitans sp. YIM 134969]
MELLDTTGAAVDAAAQARAVAESRLLLTEHWRRWCAERGLDDDETAAAVPSTEAPVVYQVGSCEADTQWVALIRFEVTAIGRPWRGMVRGPYDDPVFRVQRAPTGVVARGAGARGVRGRLGRARRHWGHQTSR